MKNNKKLTYLTVAAAALCSVFSLPSTAADTSNSQVSVPGEEPAIELMDTGGAPGIAIPDKSRLQPHSATYTFELEDNYKPTEFSDIRGSMTYNFSETCTGWITDQKLSLEMVRTDGIPVRSSSLFYGSESFSGNEYDFLSQNIIDDTVADRFVGTLFKGEGALSPYYLYRQDDKDGKTVKLRDKKIVFPVGHMLYTLAGAESGISMHHETVFDGSFSPDPVSVNTIISRDKGNPAKDVIKLFKDRKNYLSANGWVISYAYFKNDKPDMDEEVSPDYESMIHILNNGIITDLVIKYPDFVLHGRLIGFRPIERPDCSGKSE